MVLTDKQTASQRIVVRALVMGPDGVLLQHKYREDRGDYYGLPGGAKEDFETVLEALQREAREEMGTGLLKPTLIGIADYRRHEDDGRLCDHLECIFRATLPEGYRPGNGPIPDRNQRDMVWMPRHQLAGAVFSPSYIPDLLSRIENEATLGYLGAYSDAQTERVDNPS